MKSYCLALCLLFFCASQYAQTGINTNYPKGIFHIDGKKDNPENFSAIGALEAANDFIVLSNGNVGIGNLSPKVKLDLRSAVGIDNAIRIGTTEKSASAMEAGALRYIGLGGGKIQVSNGVVWEELISSPEKSFVIARIKASNASKKFYYNISKKVDGWEETQDINNDFNPILGVFTAPRSGVYLLTFSYDFVSGNADENAVVESQFVKNNTEIIVKCLKTYGEATRDMQSGGNCIASVALEEGDQVSVRIVQKIYDDTIGRGLRSTTSVNHPWFGFNNLTIVEQ